MFEPSSDRVRISLWRVMPVAKPDSRMISGKSTAGIVSESYAAPVGNRAAAHVGL
jgi:hypothetical protein